MCVVFLGKLARSQFERFSDFQACQQQLQTDGCAASYIIKQNVSISTWPRKKPDKFNLFSM